jgi:rhodanese-related sulfurtransferase
VPREIDREEVQRLIDAGAQLVEVLPSSEYEEDHLPGAINVPLSKIDAGVGQLIDRTRPVIVYCWDTA